MTKRETMLKRLQVCDFALTEAALYLDTHPDDKEALEYYQKHLAKQKETKAAYVAQFGPITQADAGTQNRWNWVDDPWPWERSK
ncbi:MAG: spore coat protein CotJB [Massiliimalia sp.]|jgi:spore coat protein JB